MKINSLKLRVEFDFDNVICKVTDTERNISDEYRCYEPFGDYRETVASIPNFNKFVGDCVEAFLDDNNYCVDDGEGQMNFKTFQSHCKYAQYGLKDGYVREFELTCRRPDRIPEGQSWGVCDEAHCPHFGRGFVTGEMIDEKTGKTLLTFTGGRIVFGE